MSKLYRERMRQLESDKLSWPIKKFAGIPEQGQDFMDLATSSSFKFNIFWKRDVDKIDFTPTHHQLKRQF